jgi:pSer/pThr/pTyr-binding forkhead associated (FHA) protein
MDIRKDGLKQVLELKCQNSKGKREASVISKRRVMIGRSKSCDIVLPFPEITSIHAVLEVQDSGDFCIYDMNSRNGTFVNGERVVAKVFGYQDTLSFSGREFKVENFSEKDVNIPPLEILKSGFSSKVELPKKSPVSSNTKVEKEKQITNMPTVEYPLAKDPRAEFSEYIFEDVETLYPIFRYEMEKNSVEVTILHGDRIFSIDYLPMKDGVYKLKGFGKQEKTIELPYLGKKEIISFIEVQGSSASIHPLPGYKYQAMGEEIIENNQNIISLVSDEVHRFENGDIQIFVRGSEAPPFVKAAPIMRRDSELKRYLFLMLFLVFGFMGIASTFNVDKEIEKEKAPERIATILYKKKLVLSETNAISKTKKKPKKKIQKSPKQKISKKTSKVKKAKEKVLKKKVAIKAKAGSKTKKKAPAKRVKVNKGPKNIKKTVVNKNRRKSTRSKSGARGGPRMATRVAKSRGAVDTYKSVDFKSSLNSMMAKGGSIKSARSSVTNTSVVGFSGIAGGTQGATAKTADVSQNVGSLVGATSGKLDSSQGVEGLVDGKKRIYTAGIPSRAVVLGRMDPDVIKRILRDHIPQFTGCYQRRLDNSRKAIGGRIKLNFVIGASGHVTRAGVDSQSRLPAAIKSCVINVLRGIQFPEPPGKGVVEVKQPMNFQARGI